MQVQRSKAEEFNASYLQLIEGKPKPILNLCRLAQRSIIRLWNQGQCFLEFENVGTYLLSQLKTQEHK
jgi:hypothetical protein